MTKEIPQNKSQKQFPYHIGLQEIIEDLKLSVSPPATRSSIIAGARRTRVENNIVYEQYPKNYSVEGLFENLKFALRYEPMSRNYDHRDRSIDRDKLMVYWGRLRSFFGFFYNPQKYPPLLFLVGLMNIGLRCNTAFLVDKCHFSPFCLCDNS